MSREETGLVPPSRTAYAWTHLAVAFVMLVITGALCGALIYVFVHTRPMNLEAFSLQMADTVEQLLVFNRVPESAISRSRPEPRRDKDAYWYYYEFDVDVPSFLSLNGVVRILANNLPRQHITVRDVPTSSGRTVELGIGERLFALVRLHGGGQHADLSRMSQLLANEAIAALDSDELSCSITAPAQASQQDAPEATWLQTRVTLEVSQPAEAEAVRHALEQAMQGKDVAFASEPFQNGEATITMAYSGRTILDIALSLAGNRATPGQEQDSVAQPEPADTASTQEAERDNLPQVALPTLSGPAPSIETALAVSLPGLEELPLESTELEEQSPPPPPPKPSPPKPAMPSPLPEGAKGARIAIVVDDGGYGGDTTERILALDPVLTLAILPGCPESTSTAKRASSLGFEVILHMPMETASKTAKFPGAITTKMSPEQIKTLTEKALRDVPGAVGANNHTGSIFTSTGPAMQNFLELLRPDKLYFLDSRTTGASIAYATAQKMSISSAERDVFLDNRMDPAYIRGQFAELVQVAKKRGSAIGICHFRPVTAGVLAEIIPELRQSGVELVHASELVH